MRYVLTAKEREDAVERLMREYPDARAELDFTTPYELLVATILSAQCTDKRVNTITKRLFAEASTPEAMVALGEERLQVLIHSAGCFRMKAKSILGASQAIVDGYHGQVPSDREALQALPGVGRKTASVVLSNAFDTPAIAVDTHVFRVSNRIGLVHEPTVEKTEQRLMQRLDRKIWSKMHHVLIFHGRRICKARGMICDRCVVSDLCLARQFGRL